MANNTGLEDPDLRALIGAQHGVVTAAQAAARGLPHETLRRRVRRGLWQRLVPGVYALQGGPPSRLQWLIAAQLYAGEGSVLTGRTVLGMYGLEVTADTGVGFGVPDVLSEECAARHRLDALVPHRTRRQNVANLHIIRTARVPKATRFGVLRLAPLARSVIDSCLAAVEDQQAGTVDGIVTAVLGDGRVSLAELEEELGKAPRRYSAEVRAELGKSRAHVRATTANRLVDELGRTGPFGAMRDVAVYVGQRRVAGAAALWPTRAVAAVVDASGLEVRTLTMLGFAVVNVTSEQIEQDLRGVLRQLGGVLMDRPEATMPAGVSLLPLASAHRKRVHAGTAVPPEAGRGEPASAPRYALERA